MLELNNSEYTIGITLLTVYIYIYIYIYKNNSNDKYANN